VTVWIALAATTALLVLGAAVQMWALWFRETPGRASDEPEAPWLTGGECRHPWRYRQVLSRSLAAPPWMSGIGPEPAAARGLDRAPARHRPRPAQGRAETESGRPSLLHDHPPAACNTSELALNPGTALATSALIWLTSFHGSTQSAAALTETARTRNTFSALGDRQRGPR